MERTKGLGIIAEMMNILEKVTLGQHYFTTAVLLRESLFLNGILTNSEIWYGLSNSEIKEFENLDHILLRKVFIFNTNRKPISGIRHSQYRSNYHGQTNKLSSLPDKTRQVWNVK